MTKPSLLLLIAVLATSPTGCRRPPSIGPASRTDGPGGIAAAYVDSFARNQHLAGIAVTVSRGDRVVFDHAYGFADLQSRLAATTDTRFRVGSVSKLFTAVLLMRLAERGALKLEAPVGAYMRLPPMLAPITLRQLAGHTGGIRHYRGNEFLTNTQYERMADAVTLFASDSLVGSPGRRYYYSSYGYNLIGAAIERATNRSFPEALNANVLRPLGLSHTGPDAKGLSIPDRAQLYRTVGDRLGPVPEDDLSGRWPSGGYLSSSSDLARFGRSLFDGSLLRPQSVAEMLTPQKLSTGAETGVGIGWRISADSAGRSYYHHGGTSNGGSAFVVVFLHERLVVGMAANTLGQWGQHEALAIASMFLR